MPVRIPSNRLSDLGHVLAAMLGIAGSGKLRRQRKGRNAHHKARWINRRFLND